MDNYFKNCPPMMSDGRYMTDWRSDVRANEYVKFVNNITRDDEYRMFLIDNGELFMNTQWDALKNRTCKNSKCIHNYPTRMLPNMFAMERKACINPQLAKTCPVFKDYRLN